jgi:hypothetical protein
MDYSHFQSMFLRKEHSMLVYIPENHNHIQVLQQVSQQVLLQVSQQVLQQVSQQVSQQVLLQVSQQVLQALV